MYRGSIGALTPCRRPVGGVRAAMDRNFLLAVTLSFLVLFVFLVRYLKGPNEED